MHLFRFWVPLFAYDISVKWVLIIAPADSYRKIPETRETSSTVRSRFNFQVHERRGRFETNRKRRISSWEAARRVQRPASESRSVKWRRCTPVRNVPILPARYYVFPLRWNLFDLFRFKSIIRPIVVAIVFKRLLRTCMRSKYSSYLFLLILFFTKCDVIVFVIENIFWIKVF